MSTNKVKRFVSIKGVLDNLRQSVNSPTPPGANQGHGTGNFQFHIKKNYINYYFSQRARKYLKKSRQKTREIQ